MSNKAIKTKPSAKESNPSNKSSSEIEPDAQDMMGNSFLQKSMNNIHSQADAALNDLISEKKITEQARSLVRSAGSSLRKFLQSNAAASDQEAAAMTPPKSLSAPTHVSASSSPSDAAGPGVRPSHETISP